MVYWDGERRELGGYPDLSKDLDSGQFKSWLKDCV